MGVSEEQKVAVETTPEQQKLLATHEDAAKALNGGHHDTSKLQVRPPPST